MGFFYTIGTFGKMYILYFKNLTFRKRFNVNFQIRMSLMLSVISCRLYSNVFRTDIETYPKPQFKHIHKHRYYVKTSL